MKSVPNLISYLHKFFWNFSQFLAIYFELFLSRSKFNSEIADMRGPPVSRRFPRRRPPISAPSLRGCHAPAPRTRTLPRHAIKASADSAVLTASLRCPSRAVASPHLASRAPVPTVPSPMSEADHVVVRAHHHRCLAASVVANSSTVSGAPSPPSCRFFSVDC
jgi:hypothetical protein